MGGLGEDLLIAGSTAYDNDAAAIDVLMVEWSRTDVVADYATRVANLRSGLLRDGTYTLNHLRNTLSGQAGSDLFFAALDDVGDWVAGEAVFH